MNIIKKYWNSVYIYVLLLIPSTCICAGIFWTICKAIGLYSEVSWAKIIAFDVSHLIYMGVSFYFIYQNQKDSSYVLKHIVKIKFFCSLVFFLQYCFILLLFPSHNIWVCTFIFLAVTVFFFDVKMVVMNILSFFIPLLAAHIYRPEEFLPMEEPNWGEIIAQRIVALSLTSFCIFLVTYFIEKILVQGQEKDEENIYLLEKQLEYYKNTEALDMELRKFRHDIQNHFIVMEYLFDKGDKEELHKYFKDLQESFSFQQKIYFSGNDTVDAILNHDLLHRCAEEVGVEVYGELPKIKTVSAMDLCTVFSNILSNAITAANNCADSKESQIVVHFGEGKRYFSISVSNSICDDKSEKNLKKKNPLRKDRNHGFGLRKIREVIEKYDGRLEQDIEGKMVTVTIYLPI